MTKPEWFMDHKTVMELARALVGTGFFNDDGVHESGWKICDYFDLPRKFQEQFEIWERHGRPEWAERGKERKANGFDEFEEEILYGAEDDED